MTFHVYDTNIIPLSEKLISFLAQKITTELLHTRPRATHVIGHMIKITH